MVASLGQETLTSIAAHKASTAALVQDVPVRFSLSFQQPLDTSTILAGARVGAPSSFTQQWPGDAELPSPSRYNCTERDYEDLCSNSWKVSCSHAGGESLRVGNSDAEKIAIVSTSQRKEESHACMNMLGAHTGRGDDAGASVLAYGNGRQISTKRAWDGDSIDEEELHLQSRLMHKRAECMVSDCDTDSSTGIPTKDSASDGAKGSDAGKVFSCFFCTRKFCSSQALGGHQNAHKRERTATRKPAYPQPLLDQRYDALDSLHDIDLISNLNKNLRKDHPRTSIDRSTSLLLNGDETLTNRSLGLKAHSLVHESPKMGSLYQPSPPYKALVGVGKFNIPPLSLQLNARNIELFGAPQEHQKPNLLNSNAFSSRTLNNSITSSLSCDQEDSLDLSLRL